MGYLSDVHYLFYTGTRGVVGTGEPIAPFALLQLWFYENFPKHDFATVTEGEDYIYVQYNDVKWYEGYDEVEAVEKALGSFDECFNTGDYDHMTGKWEMVRMGAEDHDIERRGSAHNNLRLNVHREVSIERGY